MHHSCLCRDTLAYGVPRDVPATSDVLPERHARIPVYAFSITPQGAPLSAYPMAPQNTSFAVPQRARSVDAFAALVTTSHRAYIVLSHPYAPRGFMPRGQARLSSDGVSPHLVQNTPARTSTVSSRTASSSRSSRAFSPSPPLPRSSPLATSCSSAGL